MRRTHTLRVRLRRAAPRPSAAPDEGRSVEGPGGGARVSGGVGGSAGALRRRSHCRGIGAGVRRGPEGAGAG